MTKGIIIIKSHHNNANQPVYDYFINFNDILCFHHKSKLAYKNCHKQHYLTTNFILAYRRSYLL
jgi:hypothetical protein